ncbi:DUF262 domain-containing protein [Bacillus thuringiensis]|nr:DUF262 domain-containing protein [Bacillus thuringiensis]
MFEIIPVRLDSKQTIFDWYKRKEDINFNPPYQRVGGVWKKEAKQLLIDSIINGFDLPKFYVHYHPENLSKSLAHIYSIIDGKQRLLCLIEFMEDELTLDDSFRYYKDSSIKLGNLRYSDIQSKYPMIASEFENYILDVVKIITDEDDRIEEMFLRLNEGKALNSAEKRNAITGYITSQINRLSEGVFFNNYISFNNNRYDYQDILSKIVLLELNDRFVPLSKANLDNLFNSYRDSDRDIEDTISRVEIILDKMSNVFTPDDKLLKKKALIPLYYWLIREYSLTDLNSMRVFLETFEEIRNVNKNLKGDNQNAVLIEFDRLNQQGSNSTNSLFNRYYILKRYYEKFMESGDIYIDTKIEENDLDIDV